MNKVNIRVGQIWTSHDEYYDGHRFRVNRRSDETVEYVDVEYLNSPRTVTVEVFLKSFELSAPANPPIYGDVISGLDYGLQCCRIQGKP